MQNKLLVISKILFITIAGFLNAKIYDCMTFFNEVKTLEIRLEELYDHVDHFVIVEGNVGFSGIPKTYQFPKYRHLFEKYMDKIIYVPLEETHGFSNAWERANYQKNMVYSALKNCSPDDIIMFSDVDEMPSAEICEYMKQTLQSNEIVAFQQKLYRAYYNRRSKTDPYWIGSLAMKYEVLASSAPSNPNGLRTAICFGGQRSFPSHGLTVRVVPGGWHFSSMGNLEQYIAKMDNWEHSTSPCPRTFSDRRAEIVTLHNREEIDSSFPKHIRENVAKLFQENYLDDSDSYGNP